MYRGVAWFCVCNYCHRYNSLCKVDMEKVAEMARLFTKEEVHNLLRGDVSPEMLGCESEHFVALCDSPAEWWD